MAQDAESMDSMDGSSAAGGAEAEAAAAEGAAAVAANASSIATRAITSSRTDPNHELRILIMSSVLILIMSLKPLSLCLLLVSS